MMFEKHLRAGVSTAIIPATLAYYYIDIKLALASFIASVLFSLYPDLDTGSVSRRGISIFLSAVTVTLYQYGYSESAIGILALLIVPNFFKHRGFTHTILGMIVFVGVFYISAGYCIGFEGLWPLGIAGVIGYLTHLILDWRY